MKPRDQWTIDDEIQEEAALCNANPRRSTARYIDLVNRRDRASNASTHGPTSDEIAAEAEEAAAIARAAGACCTDPTPTTDDFGTRCQACDRDLTHDMIARLPTARAAIHRARTARRGDPFADTPATNTQIATALRNLAAAWDAEINPSPTLHDAIQAAANALRSRAGQTATLQHNAITATTPHQATPTLIRQWASQWETTDHSHTTTPQTQIDPPPTLSFRTGPITRDIAANILAGTTTQWTEATTAGWQIHAHYSDTTGTTYHARRATEQRGPFPNPGSLLRHLTKNV